MTSVLAVVLAFALLIGGGTYAYLQSSTDDVKNSFATNKVEVSLKETTGQDYNIIPGTEQAKDPKVTVDNSVDAYVYVEVKDNTQGLVTYTIADGWTKLEGYENVYYREVSKDADEKTFSVLAGDKVSYSKDLTNDDMKDKTDVSLTFNATAIQKEPFGSALNAYNKEVPVSSADEFTQALENGYAVSLASNIDVKSADLAASENADVNLNGKELTINGGDIVAENKEFNFENGTVNINASPNNTAFTVKENGKVNFKNATINSNRTINVHYGTNNAEVNIIDSEYTVTKDYYAISTNASDAASGKNVKVNVINSTISVDSMEETHDSAAILFNIPGMLTVENSTIKADRQGVIVRGANATIKNSTIETTAKYINADKYLDSVWGSGNEVPVAALTVGNRSNSGYPHPSSVVAENTKFVAPEGTAKVYAAAYKGYNVTLTGIDESVVNVSNDDTSSVIFN